MLLVCREPRVSRSKPHTVTPLEVHRTTSDGRALVGLHSFDIRKPELFVLQRIGGWQERRKKGSPFIYALARDTAENRERLRL